MTKIMLIDATHPEETRVAVVDGRKLEEFDVEVASRHPLKGNIYLAKVTRVEPSLQAAFVEYGGNRHGFLAFSEIHPDYYRIPVADREALMREDIEEDTVEEDRLAHQRHGDETKHLTDGTNDTSAEVEPVDAGHHDDDQLTDPHRDDDETGDHKVVPFEGYPSTTSSNEAVADTAQSSWVSSEAQEKASQEEELSAPFSQVMPLSTNQESLRSEPMAEIIDFPSPAATETATSPVTKADDIQSNSLDIEVPAAPQGEIVEVMQPPEVIDTVGGEQSSSEDDTDGDNEGEDDSDRRRHHRHLRRYKIQEVIKRRQILLVQVTKEERGNKGAALTTYLSLAGRYCVLMPNTDRGGGISRRITSVADRKRLKSIIDELDPPEGMAVIVRTAGMERQRSEIKRDFEYLLRLWDEIRENTLRSSAPALIYEEASLIKRSIRDLYTRDIGDIVVAGADAYKSARSFMRMLAPAHAKRVQFYRDPSLPLFQRYQIESQIAAIHHPVVNLRSGGYIVINQTEALVAVDVNSGRSTRERNIEETALRTNLEAAEEVARQLRLRDLAGLIVIDFIDMDEGRNNAAVERRIKDALRNDRARIQIGRISSFGLLEMSRQRLHASLQEASTEVCLHCHGTGRMRSVDSTALHVLRMVEEEITRTPSPGVSVFVPSAVALYILNQKRHALAQLELRRGVRIYLNADDGLTPPDYRLERIRMLAAGEELPPAPEPKPIEIDFDESEDENYIEEVEESEGITELESDANEIEEEDSAAALDDGAERHNRRRRRRRRGRGGRFQADEFTEQTETSPTDGEAEVDVSARQTPEKNDSETDSDGSVASEDDENLDDASEQSVTENGEQRRRRRRGRRGGRRRPRRQHEDGLADGQTAEQQIAANVPGFGEQPDIPIDGETLPPQWRADGEPDGRTEKRTSSHQSGETSEDRPRRMRKPRRAREPERLRVSEHYTPASSVTPDKQPVTMIEVRENGEAVTTPPEDELNQPKKRGWWRRLIE